MKVRKFIGWTMLGSLPTTVLLVGTWSALGWKALMIPVALLLLFLWLRFAFWLIGDE